MIFTVVWLPSAQDELAEIWIRARDRQSVADAANRIDAVLRRDPDTKGEPFADHRVLVEPPLTVTFGVYLENRLVKVFQVARLAPSNGEPSDS